MITVAIPAIPVVAIGSRRNLVLSGITRPADGGHLPGIDFRAALRRRNLRLALPNDHNRVSIRPHFNAEHAIVMSRMN
jgi:hypothetical protein